MTSLVFVDTSALYAVLDADEEHHPQAARRWTSLLSDVEGGEVEAITHSSVIVETTALVQHRLGMSACRALLDDIVPTLTTVWIDAPRHALAATALLAAGRRHVSLVDWTSFTMMRERGIDVAFAFDADFADQGFTSWEP